MNAIHKRFGILSTKFVELPYDNIFEQKKAEKLNAEITDTGFYTVNSASDFGFIETFADQPTDFSKIERLKSDIEISLFKTIADGTMLWEGRINLERENYHHGYQRGLTEKKWVSMFYSALPAKLIKNRGQTVFGALEAFMETGTEGPIWMLKEYGKNGYEALEEMNDGDILTIYNCVFDGEIDWHGRLSFGTDSPFSATLDETSNWTHQVMRKTYHMPTGDWMLITFQHRPCKIVAM
jgi:hypothetical protein